MDRGQRAERLSGGHATSNIVRPQVLCLSAARQVYTQTLRLSTLSNLKSLPSFDLFNAPLNPSLGRHATIINIGSHDIE